MEQDKNRKGKSGPKPDETDNQYKTGKKKWVDDCTVTDSLRLKEKLVLDSRPKKFGSAESHNRTGQMLFI